MARKLGAGATAGSGGNGRALKPTDNVADVEEASKLQLLSYIGKLSAQAKKVAEAKTLYDGEKGTLTEIFRLAKASGFLRKDLQSLLDDMKADGRDLVAEEVKRRKYREWLGLPTGEEQLQLFTSAKAPNEEKDKAYWRSQGYMAGLAGDFCDYPTEGPKRFKAVFEAGWGDGQKAIINADEILSRPKPAPDPEPAPAKPESEKTKAELKAEEKALRESLDKPKEPEATPESEAAESI